MIKFVAFDLDETLAKADEPVSEKAKDLLHKINDLGVIIAIASGKPTYYTAGFSRQLGLKDNVLIGENGCVIQYGIYLPPKKTMIIDDKTACDNIKFFKEKVLEKYPSMWTQPNTIMFTPVPTEKSQFDYIEELIANNKDKTEGVSIYRFYNCFDFVPSNMSKGKALEKIGKDLSIAPSEMISVGDSGNDYSMFEYTDISIGINTKDVKVTKEFSNIEDALEYILNIIKEG